MSGTEGCPVCGVLWMDEPAVDEVPQIPGCGRCRQTVDPSRVHGLTGDGFDSVVPESPVPVLVDFFAEWCAPCRWLDPILNELATASEGRYLVAKVDVEEAPHLAERYAIGSVPTVILFREGEESGRSLGVEPERLRSLLAEAADRKR